MEQRRNLAMVLTLGGAMLFVLSRTFGTQYSTDGLAHFDVASRIHASLKDVILDSWNRPIPSILYAAGRWLGLDWIVVVPIAVTLLAGFLTFRLLQNLVSEQVTPWLLLPVFFLQWAVMEVGWQTMTEVPFYALSAGALAAHAARRSTLSYFLAGCLPLCRQEGILIAPLLGAAFLIADWPGLGLAGSARRIAWLAGPFLLWMAAGAGLTQSPLWFWEGNPYRGIISLRTGPPAWLLICNGLTRLPTLVPPLLLPFLFAGLYGLPGLVAEKRRLVAPLYVLVAAVFGLMSAVHSTPDEPAAFQAATPVRIYANAAPALAVFVGAGLLLAARRPCGRAVCAGAATAILVMIAGWPLDVLERVGRDRLPRSLYLEDAASEPRGRDVIGTALDHLAHDPHTIRYAGTVIAVSILAWVLWSPRRGFALARGLSGWLEKPAPLWRRGLVTASIAAVVLLVQPLSLRRLGPSRSDALRTHHALEAFGAWYRERHPANPPQVVQQVVHDLSRYVPMSHPPAMHWHWDAEFRQRMEEAPAGTLFLVEVVRPGERAPREKLFEGRPGFERQVIRAGRDVAAEVVLYRKSAPETRDRGD